MYMIWDYYNGEPRLIGQTEDEIEVQEIIDTYMEDNYGYDIEVTCNGFFVTGKFYIGTPWYELSEDDDW